MHLEQTWHTFFFTGASVINIRAGFYFTWVNTEESQTTYIGVSCNLKCQSWSFFIFTGFTIFFRTCARVSTHDSRSIQRRRQECTNIIKQCLNTFILERRTAEHRNDVHLQSTCTQCTQDFFFSDSRRIIKEFLHQSIIEICYFFKQFFSPFISFVNQVCRDFFYTVVCSHSLIMP